jgi:hypothetical protein
MATATAGEPFLTFPGQAFSVGDVSAAPGTEASKGVLVVDPTGQPSPNLIDSGGAFGLEVRFRMAVPGFWTLPATWDIQFYIHDLTGAAPVPPIAGSAPTPMATFPLGDSGIRGPGDQVYWSESTCAGISLADGTYRITVVGHDTATPSPWGLMFFHDGTVVHVG